MLTALRIQNVVLIEALSLAFQGGLCALTGETGAGKSILLDSLGLAIGARAEAGLVRQGAEQASVSASFDIPAAHPAFQRLHAAGLSAEGGDLILRRSIGRDGRSKAFINDQPVSVGLLKEIGDLLLEIHGQFDTQGLLNPATHRAMLDDYAGIGAALGALWAAWQEAQEKLIELRRQAEHARTQEDYLRQSVQDLDSLAPQAGEEESLDALRERLMHREKLLEALSQSHAALNDDDDPLRRAQNILSRVEDRLGEPGAAALAALDRANAEIQEALAVIQSLSADLEEGEHNLEAIDDRLFALRAQARKHGCTVDALADKRTELARQLDMIARGDDMLEEQMRRVEKAAQAYRAEALKIRAQRQKAAEKLDRLVMKELSPLKLEKARFVTAVDELPEAEWGPQGMDRLRFLVATNPGAEPGPLNKIASGGEMARFMLALKVVMAKGGSAGTLIFDEVDTGIGGATADAVGERLARLAKDKQVLVVTHAPQVAARADHHWIVRKSGLKNVTTQVVPLASAQDRREEIARMLAGATITAEARAAAEKLLETGT